MQARRCLLPFIAAAGGRLQFHCNTPRIFIGSDMQDAPAKRPNL
jgi:hypothetical protein